MEEKIKQRNNNNSNARRFLQAYNLIDHSLRAQYNFKRGQAFGDMIRRCTSINSIVRKFEDTLIDYSRLRNAIVHNGNDDYVIAEPHDDVVEKIEKMAEIICSPPLIINTVCRKDLLIVQASETLKVVLQKMYESGFSNIPVYINSSLIGVVNAQQIAKKIGEICFRGKDVDDFVKRTTVGEFINGDTSSKKYYELGSTALTIDEALNKFYANRKLLSIIITKTGSLNEPALGIVTVSDIMDLNTIMDNFK